MNVLLGVGFAGIAGELSILVLFAVLFTVLNVVGMKRYRRV